ncbi:MAG: hypothetical protein LBN00_10745 [Oscillospiraceae bacterium]|jgi:hypothetical protein|nr:hypothetical protein [Oscillospiraceae bacterium]
MITTANEMSLLNYGFEELSNEELLAVDGGGFWGDFALGVTSCLAIAGGGCLILIGVGLAIGTGGAAALPGVELASAGAALAGAGIAGLATLKH